MAVTIASSGDNGPIADMNTTPLIDVMLVLLIMFIITLPLMTNITTLQTPTGHRSTTAAEVVNVAVEFDGTVLWNGSVVESFDQFERFVRVEAAKQSQPEMHIRPDRRARYDDVARVLAIAQRNGLVRLGIVGAEEL